MQEVTQPIRFDTFKLKRALFIQILLSVFYCRHLNYTVLKKLSLKVFHSVRPQHSVGNCGYTSHHETDATSMAGARGVQKGRRAGGLGLRATVACSAASWLAMLGVTQLPCRSCVRSDDGPDSAWDTKSQPKARRLLTLIFEIRNSALWMLLFCFLPWSFLVHLQFPSENSYIL
jgi:hypothetical protein